MAHTMTTQETMDHAWGWVAQTVIFVLTASNQDCPFEVMEQAKIRGEAMASRFQQEAAAVNPHSAAVINSMALKTLDWVVANHRPG